MKAKVFFPEGLNVKWFG